MSEQLLIRGKIVPVPPEVVSEGRAAVAAWYDQQLAAPGTSDAPAPDPDAAPSPAVEE